MNVTIEDLSPVKKKLSIEVASDEVASELEKAYRKIAQTADIKGFRKGKVPRSILEQRFAPKAQYDAAGPLINNSLYKALVEHKIEAVSQPQIVDTGVVEKGQPFTYQAEVEVRPEPVVEHYKGLKLEKEKFNFDEEAVEKQLQQMAEARVQLDVTEREEARDGDTVIIDFEGFIDDAPFENGAAQDYQLEIGSNSFIPGFEPQLIGMRRNQEKKIEVTFPEGYGAKDLAGQPATFKVLLKEIKEKHVPALDDDFAREQDAENMEELRQRVRDGLVAQEQRRIDDQLQENLMKTLIEKNPLEVPEGMVQNQLMYLKDSFAQRLKAQGMSLEMLGMNDETFKSTYRDMAEQQVKGELLLDAIARQEELSATDDECEAKMETFARESNTDMEQVRKYFDNEQARAGLKAQVLQEKVSQFLLEQAEVSEVDPPQPEDTSDTDNQTEEA